jgi:hypothetical protein
MRTRGSDIEKLNDHAVLEKVVLDYQVQQAEVRP